MQTHAVFKILASYGVLFALAINLGLYIPTKMVNFLKQPICQLSLLYAACYSVTSKGSHALITVRLHYILVALFHDHTSSNLYGDMSSWKRLSSYNMDHIQAKNIINNHQFEPMPHQS